MSALSIGASQGAAQVSAQAEVSGWTWDAPAECPSLPLVRARVQARVGAATLQSALPALRVHGRLERAGDTYVLTLRADVAGDEGSAHSERRIEAASCDELGEAAALIIALAIDPNADERPQTALVPTGAPEPVPDPRSDEAAGVPESFGSGAAQPAGPALPPRAPEQIAPAEPPPPPPSRELIVEPSEASNAAARPSRTDVRRRRRAPLWLRPQLLLDAGTLPSVGAGPAAQLGVRVGNTSFEAGVSYLPDQSVEVAGVAVGELRWLAGSLGACQHFSIAWIELGPCLRVEYGRIWGRGRGLLSTQPGGAPWLAPIGSALARVVVTEPFALTGELGLGLPLLESVFSVAGLGQAHRTPTVVGRLSLGVEVVF